MAFQRRALIAARPRFSESRAAVAGDVYPGTITVAPQSALCICSRKCKTKLNFPIYFGLKRPRFVSELFIFRHWRQS